jgi:hypothetical protein
VSDSEPPVGADLASGSYRSHLEPGFEFRIEDGWQRLIPDQASSARYLYLLYVASGAGESLLFEVSDRGVDGSLDRFLRAPMRELSEPEPATVGDLEGRAVEGGLRPAPAVIAGLPGEYVISPGDRFRAIAVDVDRATVTVVIEANDDDYAIFLPVAEEVIESVSFD